MLPLKLMKKICWTLSLILMNNFNYSQSIHSQKDTKNKSIIEKKNINHSNSKAKPTDKKTKISTNQNNKIVPLKTNIQNNKITKNNKITIKKTIKVPANRKPAINNSITFIEARKKSSNIIANNELPNYPVKNNNAIKNHTEKLSVKHNVEEINNKEKKVNSATDNYQKEKKIKIDNKKIHSSENILSDTKSKEYPNVNGHQIPNELQNANHIHNNHQNNQKMDNNQKIPSGQEIPNSQENKNTKDNSIKKESIDNNKKDIIDKNNKEVIENIIEVSEDDILKAYALPNLKVESTATETIIQEKPQDKINKTYNIKQKIKDVPVGINERSIGSRVKIIKPVNKGINVQRNNNGKKSTPNYYQELLEDGREIKRSFTIQENISIAQFLMDNGVEENKAESFNVAMKDSVNHLKKGQYVIIKLEKITQYFKQHKPVYEGQYNLKKITIFFNNCVMVFIFNKGRLINKKYYVDSDQGDFSVINCEKLEDFDNLVNLQTYFSKKEYDFLSQSIDYLSNKLFHQKIKINSIKLICQKVVNDNKITQRIRGLFIYTPKEKYYCYIYKDFADNYHLLSGNGNSFNLEVLDVQSNPPIDGRISSLFGHRRHPVLKRTKHHGGLDLAAPSHTPVYAVLNGWVLSAGQHKSYGNYIIISYGNMIYTLYGHLSKVFVKTGDYVETGRLVGSVGSTGLSSGPHLHYEIFQSDVNFYTINDDKINLLFANRTVLDPGLRYKIGIGLRTIELNYFSNLIKCLHRELKGLV